MTSQIMEFTMRTQIEITSTYYMYLLGRLNDKRYQHIEGQP